MKYVGLYLLAQLGYGTSWKQVTLCRLSMAAIVVLVLW